MQISILHVSKMSIKRLRMPFKWFFCGFQIPDSHSFVCIRLQGNKKAIFKASSDCCFNPACYTPLRSLRHNCPTCLAVTISINCHFRNLNWRYPIYEAYVSGLCKGICPQDIVLYGTVHPFLGFRLIPINHTWLVVWNILIFPYIGNDHQN